MYRIAILVSHPIQYFAPLYRRLAQHPELEVKVYFCSQQGLDEYWDEGFGHKLQWDIPLLEGYAYKFLSNWNNSKKAGNFFSLINPSLVKELATFQPNALLVHGHAYFSYMLGILAARFLNIPVFMRCETHLNLQRSAAKRQLRRLVMSFLYRNLCTRCLAIGSLNRDFYLSFGLSADRIFTVPYVVDNDFFMGNSLLHKTERTSIRLQLGIDHHLPLILFASKLTPRKRPMDLLCAYRELCLRGYQAGLLFVGSGEVETQLRQFVIDHNVPNVYFAGFRNQTELPHFYAASDIFVLPSENEPWGLVINEVMCAGLPVVASAEIGAVPDLVRNGYNGFTFPSGDIAMLTGCLAALIEDETLRQKMGESSLTRIREWNLDRCAEGVFAALQSLDGNCLSYA